MEQIVRIHASSGTTGKPTVVGYTRNDIETWSMLMARSIRAAGGRASDMIHVAYGYGLFTGGLGAHYGGEHLGAAVIPVSGGFTERQVQIISDFKPDIIMVTPSYMLAIADEFDRQGIDPRNCSLRLGIFGAEPWGEGMRANWNGAWDWRRWISTGCRRSWGRASRRNALDSKGALTIWEDHFYPEIIDPVSRLAGRRGSIRRTGADHADQGRHAGHPLSHTRPDAAAAADDAARCGGSTGSAGAATTC